MSWTCFCFFAFFAFLLNVSCHLSVGSAAAAAAVRGLTGLSILGLFWGIFITAGSATVHFLLLLSTANLPLCCLQCWQLVPCFHCRCCCLSCANYDCFYFYFFVLFLPFLFLGCLSWLCVCVQFPYFLLFSSSFACVWFSCCCCCCCCCWRSVTSPAEHKKMMIETEREIEREMNVCCSFVSC